MKDKIKKKDDKKDNSSNEDINKLNINEEFKERFQHNEHRKKVEKLKSKYGKNFPIKEEENYSNEEEEEENLESEDSEGELDNEIIRDKFINTLLELKDKKETKKLLEDKNPIFTDEDFKEKRIKIHTEEEDKKIKYNINNALMEIKDDNLEDENNVYSVNYKPKKKEDDKKEKNEFIKKANEEINIEEEESENGDFFDNGLLKKKEKTSEDEKSENSNESNDLKKETNEEAENRIKQMSLDEALKKSKINTKNINMKLLNKIWGDDKKLSSDERFLRNYILSESWLEKDPNSINKNLLLIDKEDEENEDNFENFENKYNHRFEEEGGTNIITYTRMKKDDKRAIKRKEHDIRKEEENKRLKENIRKKDKEIANDLKIKIDKLEKTAGTKKVKELVDEIEKEGNFDMKLLEKKMENIFNEEYYNKKLDKNEIEEFEKKEEKDLNEEEEEENEDKENNLWFYCDNCKKPLKEGKIKYECKTCEDYTLCKQCFKTINHTHQMKKDKVPIGCNPPENAIELIKKVTEDENLICSKCNKDIVENYYFICDEDSCQKLKFCRRCRGEGKKIHEHKLHKFYINEEDENNEDDNLNPKEKLNKMIDYQTERNIDDIIDKEIPTKFHYTKVAKDDSGLTDDMLLLLDDKILNQYIPIKKLAPYNNFHLPEYKKKQMKKHLEKLVFKKKREMVNEFENQDKVEKENKKFFIGKKHKNKGEFLEKSEFKIKKRLETYGITDENN